MKGEDIELSKPLSSKSYLFLTILTNQITFIGILVHFTFLFVWAELVLQPSHVGCNANTKKVKLFWKLENEFFQFDTDHYCLQAIYVHCTLYMRKHEFLLFTNSFNKCILSRPIIFLRFRWFERYILCERIYRSCNKHKSWGVGT